MPRMYDHINEEIINYHEESCDKCGCVTGHADKCENDIWENQITLTDLPEILKDSDDKEYLNTKLNMIFENIKSMVKSVGRNNVIQS